MYITLLLPAFHRFIRHIYRFDALDTVEVTVFWLLIGSMEASFLWVCHPFLLWSHANDASAGLRGWSLNKVRWFKKIVRISLTGRCICAEWGCDQASPQYPSQLSSLVLPLPGTQGNNNQWSMISSWYHWYYWYEPFLIYDNWFSRLNPSSIKLYILF